MSDKLCEKAKAAAARESMLAPGDTVLVALSGGADSVALLRFFLEEKEKMGLRLVAAAHLNHGLRGDEAERDEVFVRRLCAAWGVPLAVRREAVGRVAAERSLGVEEAGRAVRYAFLEEEAGRLEREGEGAVKIATAHTLSDSMETALLAMTRGCGPEGLQGVPPVRGRIVRPLIDCTRAEVEAFCAARGLEFVTDSTNSDCRYSRNRVRHRVVPELYRLNPRAEEAFARLFILLRRDEAHLESEAEELYRRVCREDGLLAAPLLEAPAALRGRVLRRFALQHGAAANFRLVEEMEGLLNGQCRGVNLPEGRTVRLRNGRLCVDRAAVHEDRSEKQQLDPGDSFVFEGRVWRTWLLSGEEYARLMGHCREKLKKIYKIVLTNTLNYDMITTSIFIRSRLPGDRLHPAGRGVGKSLKKLYNEARIPEQRRRELPILCDAQGILLVPDVAADQRVRVTGQTRQVLLVMEESSLPFGGGSKYASFFEGIGER